jgi:predicted metalloenzyme YecM
MKLLLVTLLLLTNFFSYAEELGETIEATTNTGDKVILFPNSRWEYVEVAKAAEASNIAKQYPENQTYPHGSQGGWFGTRCILPGDPEFNRKSRIGN